MAEILAPLSASYTGTVSPCEYFDGIAEATNTRGIVLMSEPVDLAVSSSGTFVVAAGFTGLTTLFESYTPPTSIPSYKSLASAARYHSVRITAAFSSTGGNVIQPGFRAVQGATDLTASSVGVFYTGNCFSTWLLFPNFNDNSLVCLGNHLGNVAGVSTPSATRTVTPGFNFAQPIDLEVGGVGATYDMLLDHLTIELL